MEAANSSIPSSASSAIHDRPSSNPDLTLEPPTWDEPGPLPPAPSLAAMLAWTQEVHSLFPSAELARLHHPSPKAHAAFIL